MSVTVNGTSGLVFGDNTTQSTAGFTGFRNKIINGSLQVWQRGTGQSTGGFGSVDRFYFGWGSGALSVVKGQDIQPSPASVDGYYMLLGGTGLVNGYFYHAVEGVRTFAGQTCTLSYYYTNVSGTETGGTPYIRQVFGTGGSADVDTQPISDTSVLVNGSNQFRRTVVFNLPSVSGKTIGANNCSRIIVPCSGTFQKAYWSFQLEAGSVATPFEALPYETELSLCQRYYTHYPASTALANGGIGGVNTASVFMLNFPTQMRSAPTLTSSTLGVDWGTAQVSSAIAVTGAAILNSSTTGVNIYCTHAATGTSAYIAAMLFTRAGGYLGLTSEL
jgi:hypothetical protein